MTLPDKLKDLIDKEISTVNVRDIMAARKELTERYKTPLDNALITTQAHRLSYLITRLPATYSALLHVLQKIDLPISSVVDMGGGPGTASWASSVVFDGLQSLSIVENDSSLAAMGKRFAQASDYSALKRAQWIKADFTKMERVPEGDLIIFSYSIGEIDAKDLLPLLERAWESTQRALVIIEPGTPQGFARIRFIREELLKRGGHMVAPCPHKKACPMQEGDWCHFAARVERSSLHRKLKEGSLGHEDEKFSYIVVSKSSKIDSPMPRILRHPQKRPGHICFTLCTDEGIKQEIVSKRAPEAFKLARKLEWGDQFL